MEIILKNEKYKGDAILQKTFTVDFLTKRKKVNEGEVPMYYVENSHPAIIEARVFDLVQQEFKKRKDVKGYRTGGGICNFIQTLTDTTAIDKDRARLQNECEVVAELIRKSVEENAQSALNQEEYEQLYTQLVNRYESAKQMLEKLEEKRLDRKVKSESLAEFIKKLEERNGVFTTFDEGLWNSTVDRVIVQKEGKVTIIFKDGMKLEWRI